MRTIYIRRLDGEIISDTEAEELYGDFDIFPFEAIPDYKFKLLYQPDACALDGSVCE